MTNENTTMRYPYPDPKPEEIAVFFLREHSLSRLEVYASNLELEADKAEQRNRELAELLRSRAAGVRFAAALVTSTLNTHAPIVEPTP